MKNTLGIEIPVLDFEKGIYFYETVFGWKFDTEQYPGHGSYKLNEYTRINIFKTTKTRPKGLNVAFGVENLDLVLQEAKNQSGDIVKEKTTMGSEGSFAVIQDCFGNEISVYSET